MDYRRADAGHRRPLFAAAAFFAAVLLTGCRADAVGPAVAPAADASAAQRFAVTKTDAEWRAELTPQQYRILRRQGTEPPWSSPLNAERRTGTYHCAGCDLALFASAAKFESGTGWPSFTAPLERAVDTSVDRSLFMVRTEVHCRRCGGHLGHVFDDGPPPTGQRWCINGVALVFKPDSREGSR